jgi:hypothetical protein
VRTEGEIVSLLDYWRGRLDALSSSVERKQELVEMLGESIAEASAKVEVLQWVLGEGEKPKG